MVALSQSLVTLSQSRTPETGCAEHRHFLMESEAHAWLLRPGALRAVPRPVPRSVPRTHAPGSLRRVPASSAHFCSEEKAPPTFELFPSRVFIVRYVSITWIPLLLHARWGACGAGWGRRGVSRLLLGHKSTA